MAEYMEKTTSKKEWRRACRVIIENPLGQPQTATYVREDASQDQDGKVKFALVDSLRFVFDDPGRMVQMIDMETNEPAKEQYPVGLAAWILYSLYWELSAQKDTPIINENPVEPGQPVAPVETPGTETETPDAAKGP